MPQAVAILFGFAFTVLVCLALGRILLRRLKAGLKRHEEGPLAFLVGAAVLSAIVFWLAAWRIAHWASFLAVGVLVLAAAAGTGAWRPLPERLPALPAFWRGLFAIVFSAFGALYFLHAMAPEMSPDGSGYHLGLVGRYLRDGGFQPITTNMYAALSQGSEMLFMFAFAFGEHSAAALVHFAFLLALPLAILNYGRRFGYARAGAAGALFVFASPVVGIDGSSAYNDVAVACVLFGLFYILQVWDQSRVQGLLLAAGLLAGFGYALKYTAFVGVPYALGFAAWRLYRARQPLLKPLVLVSLAAFVLIGPWAAKNWIWLDNPVAPFFNRWFPNPYVHVSFEQDYARHMRNYEGLSSHWAIPLEVTVRGHVLGGLLGPLFLLAPVGLLALRHSHGRRLLLMGLLAGLPYAANIGTRFLIPPLPFLALAMGMAAVSVRGLAAVLVMAHALLSWPSILKKYCATHAWRIDRVNARAAFRIIPQDEYLRSRWPGYHVARLIDEYVPPGEKLLTFTQPALAYNSREILVVYQSALGEMLGGILWTPLIYEFQATRWLEFRFPPEPLRKVRAVQTAEGGPDQWTINEFRVFSGGRELPRSPRWLLTAKPFPWDVQMAFDNSLVTRWGSWQVLYPGMYVEVDFGRPETVDSVVLESSRDQYKTRLLLEGLDASGQWKQLAGEPREHETAPALDMRRAATQELKLRGVRYLLIWDHDFSQADFYERAEDWGITMLADYHGTRIYRIE